MSAELEAWRKAVYAEELRRAENRVIRKLLKELTDFYSESNRVCDGAFDAKEDAYAALSPADRAVADKERGA